MHSGWLSGAVCGMVGATLSGIVGGVVSGTDFFEMLLRTIG